jgi:hypothetical protein
LVLVLLLVLAAGGFNAVGGRALLLRGSMFENSQQRPNCIAPLLES